MVFRELVNIPTDTLIDILFVILTGEEALTVNDVGDLDQIQRELQRRDQYANWSYWTVN